MPMTPRPMPSTLMYDGTTIEPRANRLLAALTTEDLENWMPLLVPTLLLRGQVLRADQAYFPTTATVSLFAGTSSGDSTELATVGYEGFIGVGLMSGTQSVRDRAEVSNSGYAYALAGTALRSEFQRSSATMELFLRYMQLHMAQTIQRAVCVQHHSTKQRLCRCLLDSLDRDRGRNTIELTHESMAARLGVRRETVTGCAQQLQNEGIMAYRRGFITVHDVPALRASSCSCYDEMRSTHDRLLPTPEPALYGDRPHRVPAPTRGGFGLSSVASSSRPQVPLGQPRNLPLHSSPSRMRTGGIRGSMPAGG